ncbi:hypothetical protein [Paenibacillus xerothermodurans]|uniref:Permease n=1 Tax=Paenibacillus xerothermodurans TaxID=1977292 RepID=A0A2W1NVQ7_PAEXE|nr:hypothetical protein [Paenibacillus xerothermodurans]PZE19772.1 permease [Paenibacillus xerothermodurans]
MQSRVGYLIIGFLLLCLSGYIFFDAIWAHSTVPLVTSHVFAVSVLLLSYSYLHPQFKKKDERMKIIREKGMHYSFLVLMLYFIIFVVLLSANIVSLTAIAVVQILISLTIITVALCMVILSKIY